MINPMLDVVPSGASRVSSLAHTPVLSPTPIGLGLGLELGLGLRPGARPQPSPPRLA